MGFLDAILKVVSLPLKVIIAIALFTFAILMFLQKSELALFLTNILPSYKQWFLLANLFCDAMIFVYSVHAIIKRIKVYLQKRNKTAHEK